MNFVDIKNTPNGFVVSGAIRFSNVLRLRRQGNRYIREGVHEAVEIDLSQVDSSDTSGLSLLLRWVHFANQKNKNVIYKSIPVSLLKMADVCGISDLIIGR